MAQSERMLARCVPTAVTSGDEPLPADRHSTSTMALTASDRQNASLLFRSHKSEPRNRITAKAAGTWRYLAREANNGTETIDLAPPAAAH
jgi:hypothetical protein